MNRLKTCLLPVLLLAAIAAMPPLLSAQQNTPPKSPDAEVERLKLQAQERQELEQRDWQTRIFEIKYAQPYVLRQALSMFRAAMNPDPNSRILAIKAPKDIMPAIEDAIKRLDVPTPRRDAELTVFVVMASDQPEGEPLPPNLQPVITELRKVLAYKGFRLIDTLMTRGGENRDIALQGALPSLSSSFSGTSAYDFRGRLNVENGALHVSTMRFQLTLPNPAGGNANVSISTDVEIPPGQQVVVGKATFVDKAFILIMTARF